MMLLCSAVISLCMRQYDDAFSITMVTTLLYYCNNLLTVIVGHHNCSHCGVYSRVSIRKIT